MFCIEKPEGFQHAFSHRQAVMNETFINQSAFAATY